MSSKTLIIELPLLLMQMTLRRALSPMLPNLDAQLMPYSRSRTGQSASRPVTSAPHAPARATDPPAHRGPHSLGDAPTPSHTHPQAERHVQPRHLPLASDFSVSSIENHNPGLHQTGDKGEKTAVAGNQTQLPYQPPLTELGPEPSTTRLGTGPFYTAPQPQGTFAPMAPPGSVQPTQGQLAGQYRDRRIPITRQQSPLCQHQQLNSQCLSGEAGPGWPGRVSVDTASSVRRTVITVAELQSTVQPEASSTRRAYHADHVGARIASAASLAATQDEEEAAAGVSAHPDNAAHDALPTAFVQQGMSAPGPPPEADPLQRPLAASAAHPHDRALQNSPALNSAHHRANSPPFEGKAASKGPAQQLVAARCSDDDAVAVLQAEQAVIEGVLMTTIQDVQHAEDDVAAAAALQAMQDHISCASPAALQACLPQVRACYYMYVYVHARICGVGHPGFTWLRTILPSSYIAYVMCVCVHVCPPTPPCTKV